MLHLLLMDYIYIVPLDLMQVALCGRTPRRSGGVIPLSLVSRLPNFDADRLHLLD